MFRTVISRAVIGRISTHSTSLEAMLRFTDFLFGSKTSRVPPSLYFGGLRLAPTNPGTPTLAETPPHLAVKGQKRRYFLSPSEQPPIKTAQQPLSDRHTGLKNRVTSAVVRARPAMASLPINPHREPYLLRRHTLASDRSPKGEPTGPKDIL